MRYKFILIFVVLGFFACKNQDTQSTQETKNTIETEKDLTNKDKAVALLKSLETGNQNALDFINPNKYIQHNLSVGDGLEGFKAIMKNAPDGGFKVNVVRVFQDGDYVFTHAEYDFFGPKVGIDIFKFEDGKIVEHWDNLEAKAPPNPSGRTQTDGAASISDLASTKANKQIVEDFVNWVLIEGHFDEMANYFQGYDLIQHNPSMKDGLTGLGGRWQEMARTGKQLVVEKSHKILGEGNFVLTVTEGKVGDVPTSFYDLYRMENLLIVEHWDVTEPILPEADRKNNNGKFNF